MKRSDLSKVVGSALLTASLAVVPLAVPASAQNNTAPAGDRNTYTAPNTDTNTNTAPRGDVRGDDSENDVDWGWLGLLGLLGLGGLARKPQQPVRYRETERDPDSVTRSTTYTP